MPGMSVFVVSPSRLVCDLLRNGLQSEHEVSCAGTRQALDGAEEAILRASPDVVVLDAAFDESGATDLIHDCLRRRPDLQCLVLYDSSTLHTAVECVAAGASACISTQCAFDEFLDRVSAAASGVVALPPEVITVMVRRFRDLRRSDEGTSASTLSEREKAMLDMLVHGAANKEIARSLSVSPHTVKKHLTKLYRRLGVTGRMQAAAWWRDRS